MSIQFVEVVDCHFIVILRKEEKVPPSKELSMSIQLEGVIFF